MATATIFRPLSAPRPTGWVRDAAVIANAISKSADGKVKVEMTLTTPSCPSAQELPSMTEEAIRQIPGVTDCEVEVVWDPPWDQSRMSEDARLALNMF